MKADRIMKTASPTKKAENKMSEEARMMSAKRIGIVALIVLLALPTLAISSVSAQQGETTRTGFRYDAPPYAIRGPQPVGYMTFSTGEEADALNGIVWYPALQAEDVEESATYDMDVGDMMPPIMNLIEGRAIENAPANPEGAPYPLVITSHALGGSHLYLSYLDEQLASYGFVVMAFTHPGTGLRDNIMAQTDEQIAAYWEDAFDSLVTRPLDVRRAIDYAAVLSSEDGALNGIIDTENVGVTGLSIGGYTVLAAAGAQLDLSPLVEFCQLGVYSSLIVSNLCARHPDTIPDVEARLLALAGASGASFPSLGDPRIKAIAPIVPGPMQPLDNGKGLAAVQVPMMILYGTADQIAIPEYNANYVWEYVGSASKTKVVFENAGHLFSGYCNAGWQQNAPIYCSDPVWDTDRAHDLVDHFVTAFFLAALYGDADAAAALAPDAVQFPGISYETTGF
jgi:predicted dienelactone hydrolase